MSMSVGISLAELLSWDQETSAFWKKHFEANPAQLELPCDIGGSKNVQDQNVRGLLRHNWGVELRWVERLAALPVTPREELPEGPLDALYDMHLKAAAIFRELLAAPDETWEQPFKIDWIPSLEQTVSRRKLAGHMLFHGQRHWAQLSTLLRTAGLPSNFRGDLLLSQALE
jgi:uncharacterized damage-inducible protein DinB